ncbi:MAG: peptidase M14, partial [Acidobacteriota bacterium]
TSRQTERRPIPEGALWIPAAQPDFEVAVQLLEPEAPDSLVRWGLLNSVFERKEYIGLDTLENLARDKLSDPEIRANWEEALKDEDFACNGGARYIWWYRRTQFWDETIGLMPVYRVMDPIELPTSREGR